MSDLPKPREVELIYRSRKDGSEIRLRFEPADFEYKLLPGHEQRPEVLEMLAKHGLL